MTSEVERTSGAEPTIGKLIKDAQADVSLLLRKEIQLLKAELKVSVTAGGLGAAFLAAAAFLLVLGVIMLSVSIAYFIHWAGLGLHWSFLIVFGFYLLLAAILAWLGIRKFKQVGPPERAIEQGKEIPKALKGQS